MIALLIGDLHSAAIKISGFSDNFKITHRNHLEIKMNIDTCRPICLNLIQIS